MGCFMLVGYPLLVTLDSSNRPRIRFLRMVRLNF
jgi:hypothetical protein